MFTVFMSVLVFVIYWKLFFYRFTGADFFPTVYGSTSLEKVFLGSLGGGIFPFGEFYRPFHSLVVYFNYSLGGLDGIT